MALSNPELIKICRGLALLLDSGIGGAECAFLLAREEQPPLESVLNTLGEHLDRGFPMAEAMAEAGGFPDYVLTMVHIGQETGRLAETLAGLGDYYAENDRTLRQIRSAVAYPAMVLILMLLVVGVLLVKVLPVFDRVYASLGTRLTGVAAGLLHFGQLLEGALPVLAAVLLALAAAAVTLWLRPSLREKVRGFWQKRWGDRGISRKWNNARFAQAMMMGFSSGISVEESVELAAGLLQQIPGALARCRECHRLLSEGEELADALTETQLLPHSAGRLLKLGVRSGNGDAAMEEISRRMTEDARQALEELVSRVEPALVLVTSALVGVILLSVMLPLMNIMSAIG